MSTKQLTSKERVLKTLRHEEPDRVPIGVLAFSSTVGSKILGRLSYTGYRNLIHKKGAEALVKGKGDQFIQRKMRDRVELNRKLGIDTLLLIPAPSKDSIIPKFIDSNTWIYANEATGEWRKIKYSPESGMCAERDSNIKKGRLDEFRRVTLLLEKRKSEVLNKVRETEFSKYPDGIIEESFILGMADIRIPFETSWFDVFLEAILLEPNLVERYLDIRLEITLASLKRQIEFGIDGVTGGVDFAYNKGLMFSPTHFHKLISPRLKVIVDECHRNGLFYIKHTDGDIRAIERDLFLEVGVDGYNPIDISAGMDLEDLKNKYGQKITLWGNVDDRYILAKGSREEVIEEVKRCLITAAKGGGYILGTSSGDIHSGVSLDNFLVMLEAAKKYGTYPIKL